MRALSWTRKLHVFFFLKKLCKYSCLLVSYFSLLCYFATAAIARERVVTIRLFSLVLFGNARVACTLVLQLIAHQHMRDSIPILLFLLLFNIHFFLPRTGSVGDSIGDWVRINVEACDDWEEAGDFCERVAIEATMSVSCCAIRSTFFEFSKFNKKNESLFISTKKHASFYLVINKLTLFYADFTCLENCSK